MAIENIENINEDKLSLYERRCLKEARSPENILNIVNIYGEATEMFGPTTDRDMFMDHIFSQCATIFEWNLGDIQNSEQMKYALYQYLFTKSAPKDGTRPKGIIPAIASYTVPRNQADFEHKMSDLEVIEYRIKEEMNLLKTLMEDGPARQKALAKLAENPNRRNTPEVTLQMKLNAKKIELKDMLDKFREQERLVRASRITQGNFFTPERPTKNATVQTAKVFDNFLGQGGSNLEDLIDLTDLT